jgi:hypothetical protein
MAVAIVLDFEGGTLDQYDNVVSLMGLTPGGKGAPGGMFHWVTATATENGIRVTDVWQSRELFEEFAQTKIGPLTGQAGMAAPKITMYPVHSYLVAG